jgi:hypothetical protein
MCLANLNYSRIKRRRISPCRSKSRKSCFDLLRRQQLTWPGITKRHQLHEIATWYSIFIAVGNVFRPQIFRGYVVFVSLTYAVAI